MIKLVLLVASIVLLCSCHQQPGSLDICFSIKGQNKFTIGKPLPLSSLKITYGIDEGGVNFGKNNHIKDYASVDTALKITTPKGPVSGALIFSIHEQTNELISLNCFWPLMIEDNEAARTAVLTQIKDKYLPCLDINKLDIKNGGDYSSSSNGRTETFTLTPRFRNGVDANYWAFYYAVK